jgi:TatD DNase family protein
VLTQCANLSINRIIIPAISPENFDSVLSLADNHHKKPIKLYPCLVIHPWFLDGLNDVDLECLATKVIKEKNRIVAIGETGIDGANIKRSIEPDKELTKQLHFFDFQLNLAKQQNLPVIIHHRQSHQHIVPLLRRLKLARAGIIHGFTGSYQQAKDYLDLGFKLGIGSTITYSRAKKTINTIKRLPLESLVLETDAPSMPLSSEIMDSQITPHKEVGYSSPISDEKTMQVNLAVQENSPINLIKIFNVLTVIRTESPEQISHQIEANIEHTFFC